MRKHTGIQQVPGAESTQNTGAVVIGYIRRWEEEREGGKGREGKAREGRKERRRKGEN